MSDLPFGRFYFDYVGALGAGGLGKVDKILVTRSNAPSKPVGSEWACKRLNAQWAAHSGARERFEREIKALKIMSHPNIVSCEGENTAEGTERFYVMPFYSGTLRRYIASGGHRGDWRFFASLAVGLTAALEYAHGLGIRHRDLKPDNILFNGGGPLIIADWGFGYFVHKHSKVLQQLTRGGMGTEYYCSLEQWGTGKCDEPGDVYSLGMTIDECVTGSQRSIMIGMGVNGPSAAEKGDGARAFNALLRAMTRPVATQRVQRMADVAAELQRALAST